MKTQILLLISVLFTGNIFGQGFQRTIYNPEKDFNHYSIENTKAGYVCVGTLFGEENNDIHIVNLRHDGQILWERIIDETKDDRGLDVAVDVKNNIVLTGYISPGGPGFPNLYIAKMDLSGNYIGDRSIVNVPPSWGHESMTAGTNIIYSKKTETYIVGGIIASKFERPLQYNRALITEFDLNLNLLNQKRIFTGSKFQSINDIQAVPEGYFITGGIARLGNRQGVLAAIVDFDLDLVKNFSFDDFTEGKHLGASIVYDGKKDDIYVLSNNETYSNPQVTRLKEVSNEMTWCDDNDIRGNSYLLEIDDNGDYKAAGFKLEKCVWNDKHLIASGYFQKRSSDYGKSGTIAWIIEFDKITGARVSGMEWTISPANGFTDQGGVLSEYRFSSPLYYTQEMFVPRNDRKGYVIIAPRLIDNKYSLELLTTSFMNVTDCFKELRFRPIDLDLRYECIDQADIDFNQNTPKSYLKKIENKEEIFCNANYTSKSKAEPIVSESLNSNQSITVYPNPANDNISIQLPNGTEKGKIEVINLTGKIILQKDVNTSNFELKIENLENGLYFIRFNTTNGEVHEGKFIKAN